MDDDPVLLHHNPYNEYQHSPSHSQLLQITNPRDLMAHLERLKFFLATAPSRWSVPDAAPNSQQHPALNRFLLPSGEYVTCVLWSGLYHITGTDIVRALVFRFEAFGRPVRNMKKFEEGVFSDLRNLKPGHDACLEEPKSPFLDLLFKYQCIRTQKKQKVFYWFSVPHDRLFLDALERDLKREKMGLESTTAVVAEPAASFAYDPKRSLYEQFAAAIKYSPISVKSESSFTHVPQVQAEPPMSGNASASASASTISLPELDYPSASSSMDSATGPCEPPTPPAPAVPPNPLARTPFFHMLSLFEGSPTYKQRRKKIPKSRKSASDEPERDRPSVHSQPHQFLAGPGQFGFSSAEFPPSAHVARLAQQMRGQHSVPPAPEHACPLFSCRRVFPRVELLHDHMRTHETVADQQLDRGMDVDPRDVEAVEGGSPQSQFVAESPNTPQYVLTSPGGSPGYEDQQAYNHSAQWTHHSESPAYSAENVPHPTPGYMQDYTYDSSTTSGSPSDALPAPSASAPPQPFYEPLHPYPVSAPSHRLTFDLPSPPSSETVATSAYISRRPRSVTPSHPNRVTHARRPSTANEVPSSFGASVPAPTWRHHHAGLPHPHGHYARGYHPYAPPAPEHSYSTDSAHSSPGTSPFAVSLNTPAEEYPPESSPHARALEYAARSSPHMFAHMANLEHSTGPGASPVEGLQLSYPQVPGSGDGYDDGSGTYGDSPEGSVVEQHSSEYEYAHGSAEYGSSPPSPADAGMYHMVQSHDPQMHHHYYEQQVV